MPTVVYDVQRARGSLRKQETVELGSQRSLAILSRDSKFSHIVVHSLSKKVFDLVGLSSEILIRVLPVYGKYVHRIVVVSYTEIWSEALVQAALEFSSHFYC